MGLDFSSASAVVFAELPDKVAHVRQAEDRAHRQGQKMAVNVYFLIARSTTDERRSRLCRCDERQYKTCESAHNRQGLTH